MRRTLISTFVVTAVLLAGCGTEAGSGADSEQDTAVDGAETDSEPEAATETDDGVIEEPEPASDLPDSPQPHSSLYTDGVEPNLDTTDGEVTVAAIASMDDSGSFPMVVHNGTDSPISRVEVSGAAVGSDGSTVSSGSSQGFEPNVIEPGGIGIGYVYVSLDLPEDVTLDQISIDYTTGLGDFENIVVVDVTDVSASADRVTGTVTNPHDVGIDGPISVSLACLDDAGALMGVHSTFADRDAIDPGGSSTFTVESYGRTLDCAGIILGASGYDADW
jgi:predicted small secreted protein